MYCFRIFVSEIEQSKKLTKDNVSCYAVRTFPVIFLLSVPHSTIIKLAIPN
jgi:hypothetical protein